MKKILILLSSLRRAVYLSLIILVWIHQTGFSQEIQNLDSLELSFRAEKYDKSDRLMILNKLAREHEDNNKKILYSTELIEISDEMDSIDRQFNGYIARGHAQITKGEFSVALEDYFEASKIAGQSGDEEQEAIVNLAIAGGYSRLSNNEKALEYYKYALSFFRTKETDNFPTLNTGYTLFNIGEQYLFLSKPDSAMLYFNQANPIFQEHKDRMGQAYIAGSKGKAYALLGENELALKNLKEAVDALFELDNFFEAISEYQLAISQIYLDQGELESAETYAQLSLNTSEKYDLKPEMRDANLTLSKIYEAQGQPDEAFDHYQSYVQLKDSLVNLTTVRQLADMRTDFEVSQKQLEVDLLNTEKRTQRVIMYALGLILLLTAIYYRRIVKEKSRSDSLLLNILPTNTAKELKEKGKVEARKFEAVTVMFTDFEAFTRYSQNLSPEKLVKSVDHYFSAFDKIIEKHGLEKIKTIGDSYMCTGGLISKGPMQPVKVIQAAFEIIDFVQKEKESDDDEIAHFDIRIGINTGPVVAGVVGTKKFAYDIWGDTVNVAARMETNSHAGKINISENTYSFVKDRFECEYRGEIDVKNKGKMKMYFVTKHEASSAPHRP